MEGSSLKDKYYPYPHAKSQFGGSTQKTDQFDPTWLWSFYGMINFWHLLLKVMNEKLSNSILLDFIESLFIRQFFPILILELSTLFILSHPWIVKGPVLDLSVFHISVLQDRPNKEA